MDFAVDPANVPASAYAFFFVSDELLVEETGDVVKIPPVSALKTLHIEPELVYYMGLLDGNEYYAAGVCAKNVPEGFSFIKVRQLYGQVADACYAFMLRAFHIVNWLKTNRYCGCCCGSMAALADELAVKCAECGHVAYPRLSPAIIVAIVKDDKLLLARSNRFPPGRYSVIAGFVEPGESLEECVEREVKEEVGIAVTNIKYFGSQPWPFPDSLMIAFTAEWQRGIITIDNEEIVSAGWFSADSMPSLPGKESIARKLIDWFTATR